MAGFRDFLQQNAKFNYGGIGGAPFAASDLAGVATADNKFKALLKTFKDLVFIKVGMVGVFTAVGAAVRSLVRDTGSLDAALRKLSQVQGFQRQFAPLLGGLTAAKQRVAELVALSNRGPFRFDELASANRKLEVFTRGAFSGVAATQTIGKAAIATGNDITETADAVGSFYATLREGAPIDSAAERLRQMGIISQGTADRLVKMAETGTAVSSTFSEFSNAIESTGESAKGYAGEIATVTAEHEKAVATLKEKFGSPFTDTDIQNTKNMTDALIAITPAVGNISEFLAKLYNGFATAGTAIVKFAAQSTIVKGGLELFVRLLGFATVAALLFGATAIPNAVRALAGLASGMYAAGGASAALAVSLRVLALGTLIGVVATALVAGVGAFMNFNRAMQESQQRVQEWADAHKEATAALAAQVGAVTDLTSRNEALAKSISEIIRLEKERASIISDPKNKPRGLFRNPFSSSADTLEALTPSPARQAGLSEEAFQKLQTTNAALNDAKRLQSVAAAIPTISTPQSRALTLAESERQRNVENQQFEAAMANATPERRIQLLAGQRGRIGQREQEAFGGLESAAAIEERRARIEGQLAPLQTQLGTATGAQKEVIQTQIAALQAKQLAEGLKAPETSAIFQETVALQLRHAAAAAGFGGAGQGSQAINENILAGGRSFDQGALKKAEIKAELARQQEGQAGGFGSQKEAIQSEIDAANRELAITISRAATERQIASLKSEGADRAQQEYSIRQRQIVDELALLHQQASPDRARIMELEAQRASNQRQEFLRQRGLREERSDIGLSVGAREARFRGQTGRAVSLEDLQDFTRHFEQLQEKFGPQEAARLAMSETRADMQAGLRPGGIRAVADSLAKIGGGGGVYAPGGDPMLQIAKRQAVLQKEAVDWLMRIYQNGGGTL